MFKLNKKGWGVTTEVTFLLIFVVCLIIFFVGVSQLGLFENINETLNPNYYNNTDTTPNEQTQEFNYVDLENSLTEAGKKYIKEVYNDTLGLDTLIVRVSLLKDNNYLSDFVDGNNKKCSGYVEVYLENDLIKYDPFVKCRKYETSGYVERKDY